jgi:hypothetical protein
VAVTLGLPGAFQALSGAVRALMNAEHNAPDGVAGTPGMTAVMRDG